MTSLAVVARGRVYELGISKFQNKSKPFDHGIRDIDGVLFKMLDIMEFTLINQ